MAKKHRQTKELIIHILIILLGLMISSFGTALFYQANMGSGAMATFSDGLHRLLGISYGTANLAANIFFVLLLFFCERRMINIGTILCVTLIGVFVDMGNLFFVIFSIAAAPPYIRFGCVLIGCLMMGIGLSLYVAVDRGYGALEGLVKYLCAKTGLSFDKVKIGQDLLLIVLGIALKAKWGPGTLISAITVGPIMKFFIPVFQRILHRESIEINQDKVNL